MTTYRITWRTPTGTATRRIKARSKADVLEQVRGESVGGWELRQVVDEDRKKTVWPEKEVVSA